MSNSGSDAGENASAEPATKKRVVIIRRKKDEAGTSTSKGGIIVGIAACLVLALGIGMGYRVAQMLLPHPTAQEHSDKSRTERVNGGLYALELARPEGKARWMLEFDADIVTKEGPSNPLVLRNALEKLVIDATSLPLVQTSDAPEEAARSAMLAMAEQDFPWLVEIYLTRSDIRAQSNKLNGIGEAMRTIH